MRTLAALVLAIGFGCVASRASAQVREVRQGDDRLKGISAVDVAIDPVSEEAARCGITREMLQKTAVDTLAGAGLKASLSEKASSWFYTVYATVSSLTSGRQCSSSVVTELTAQVAGIPEADRHAAPDKSGSLLVGQLTLIRHNGIVSSRTAGHAGDVRSLLREHLTGIARRIAAANK